MMSCRVTSQSDEDMRKLKIKVLMKIAANVPG